MGISYFIMKDHKLIVVPRRDCANAPRLILRGCENTLQFFTYTAIAVIVLTEI
jgi:hypothetical protein